MLNQLFAIGMFILGIILIVLNFQIDSSVHSTQCVDTQLQNCNKGILVLGTAAIVASASYLGCQIKSGSGQSIITTEMYASFCLVLGIVIVVLGSIMQSRANKSTSCTKAKNKTTPVIILGSLMIVIAGGYLSLYVYNNMGGKESVDRMRKSVFKRTNM